MTADTENQILKAIDVWEQTRGILPPVVALYRQLLRIQVEAAAVLQSPYRNLAKEVAHDRLKQGQPLLEFSEIAVDWNLFQSLFNQTCSILSSYPEFHDIPSCRKDPDLLRDMARSWYCGEFSSSEGSQSGTLGLVMQTALKPFLNIGRDGLQKSILPELWLRHYCLICGGSPDFAFLDRDRGARHLVCSRCDSSWLFKRIECPNCGNQDQNTLAYFTDDKGLYRLYVCDRCKDYLKAVDLRNSQIPVFVQLERFLTLDLDSQARRNGYSAQMSGRVFRKPVAVSY